MIYLALGANLGDREASLRLARASLAPQPEPARRLQIGNDQDRSRLTARARTLLKWQPRVPLSEGLVKTIAYFRTKV